MLGKIAQDAEEKVSTGRSSPKENAAANLPRNCTFVPSDWRALAPFWYPVAFSHEVKDKPFAARLLDERLVIYRVANGSVVAARDLCLHRGVPLSMGFIEGDHLVCAYHGLRYDGEGRCVCIPAHPGRGHSAEAPLAELSGERTLRPRLGAAGR